MLINYFKIAVRNLLKNKVYFILNITGLTIGIAASILALIFVLSEYSYDQFHSNKKNIYRVNKVSENWGDGLVTKTSENPGLLGPTLVSEFPEVKAAVRILPWWNQVLLSNKDKNVQVDNVLFADDKFFQVFDFNLVEGDPITVLQKPLSIVLTENVANTLFPNQDALGQIVVGLNDYEYTVTGIVAKPSDSHIEINGIISWSSTEPDRGYLSFTWMNNWLAQGTNTYLLLNEGSKIDAINKKFVGIVERYMPNRIDNYTFYLQPFEDIYLFSSDLEHVRVKTGSINYVKTFVTIALLLILVASINYININTAKYTKRAYEVGIRKVLGAGKRQLFIQFMTETFLITFLSGLLAILIVDLVLPVFNQFSGKSLDITALNTPIIFGAAIGLITGVSFLSGFYPALLVSSLRPVDTIKKSASGLVGGEYLRKTLIVFQFVVSAVLIASTILVYQQTQFMNNKDLGIAKDQLLIINNKSRIVSDKSNLFVDELSNHSGISYVSASPSVIGNGTYGTTCFPEGHEETEFGIKVFRVDYNYLDTYGIKLNEGRFFDPKLTTDAEGFKIVINETMAQLLGWEKPIGKNITFDGAESKSEVIGVVKDFNFNSLYSEIEPVVMFIESDSWKNITVRLTGNDISSTLSFIDNTWKKYESRYPFDYYFADQWFANNYKSEQQLLNTVTLFSVICIFIACIGLYGLTTFTIEQRTKEIGIRKVLGATISGLAILINRQFFSLVMIAFFIGIPLSYYLISEWLNDFAYRIEISPIVYLVTILSMVFIALISVSYQSIKAALMNPVETLRSE